VSNTPPNCFNPVNLVTDYDFASDINGYLASLEKSSVKSLEDLIQYNEKHAAKALPDGKELKNQLFKALTFRRIFDARHIEQVFKPRYKQRGGY
jgi:hypothetical protein